MCTTVFQPLTGVVTGLFTMAVLNGTRFVPVAIVTETDVPGTIDAVVANVRVPMTETAPDVGLLNDKDTPVMLSRSVIA